VPLRKTHLLTGIIKCADCLWNMRKISDRKTIKYICGQYSTDVQKCSRNAIKEEDIIYLLCNHYLLHNRQLELSNKFLSKEINQISYSNNKGLIIKFKNKLPDIIATKDLLKFIK
jgi:hypothetical protein